MPDANASRIALLGIPIEIVASQPGTLMGPAALRTAGIGRILGQLGFTVEDRDRAKGIYFVRYADPQAGMKKDTGLLSKLAFWRSTDTAKPAAQYQVVVNAATNTSQVRILGKDGGPDSTGASQKILALLYDQLK